MDTKALLRDLNEVLAKYEARIYIQGYESDAWINHKGDNWAHESIRLTTWGGVLHNVKELY